MLLNLQVTSVIIFVTSPGELDELFGAAYRMLTDAGTDGLAGITTVQDDCMEMRRLIR